MTFDKLTPLLDGFEQEGDIYLLLLEFVDVGLVLNQSIILRAVEEQVPARLL